MRRQGQPDVPLLLRTRCTSACDVHPVCACPSEGEKSGLAIRGKRGCLCCHLCSQANNGRVGTKKIRVASACHCLNGAPQLSRGDGELKVLVPVHRDVLMHKACPVRRYKDICASCDMTRTYEWRCIVRGLFCCSCIRPSPPLNISNQGRQSIFFFGVQMENNRPAAVALISCSGCWT